MNVLSLFDGVSTGYQALKDLGIKVDNYFASEVDKYAISIAKHNHPDIKHLGDVCGVEYEDGALFHHQNDNPMVNGGSYIARIDLLIGGSPCQGFSFAGRQLNFEDPRSKLFFEFVRLLKETKPKYFMLENVRMKKEYQDVISEQLGVQPTMINSALVSAQNRVRLYWVGKLNDDGTYSKVEISQPEDRGILLKDIIVNAETEKEKSYCIDANYAKGANLQQYLTKSRRQLVKNNSLCIQVGEADIRGQQQLKRVYSTDGKSPTLTTMQGGHQEPKISQDDLTWRKLTPLECERLQTMADGYTALGNFNGVVKPISNSQRYKTLGNGWTCEVIKHIFNELIKI